MAPITEKSIGLDGGVFSERRCMLRRKTLKGAIVSFNNGYSSLECVVRNLSDDGALLSLGETFALPNEFWLMVSNGRARKATVCWRGSSQMGVHLA